VVDFQREGDQISAGPGEVVAKVEEALVGVVEDQAYSTAVEDGWVAPAG
jgi:hypothetical protein